MACNAVQTLLAGVIDYAGLFPPSSESMREAVLRYRDHSVSTAAWVLGRLIIPVDRLDEFGSALTAGVTPSSTVDRWHISCLWPAETVQSSSALAAACRTMKEFVSTINERSPLPIVIDTVEVVCESEQEIERLKEGRPDGCRVFVEIPMTSPLPPCLDRLMDCPGLAAKVRTGGVVPAAIPAVDRLAEFLQAAIARSLPFKCTAGLHHPLPGTRPLTYREDAPRGVMHGFCNVALAAGLAMCKMIDDRLMREVLADQEASSFQMTADYLAWKSFRMAKPAVGQLRQHGFLSFGSCSFREPIEDLGQLGWLPSPPAPCI